MKKNVAGQTIGVQMVTATDGTPFTGAVTVYITGDAGTQAIGSVGSGLCTHEGNGYHTYRPSQAETNADQIAFTFIGSGAVPATIQVYTDQLPVTAGYSAGVSAPTEVSGTGTTVAELMDELKGKIPDGNIPTLFPVLNRAIQAVAKRLYMLESDLIEGELDVKIYAEVTITAATIAFVSGGDAGSDTIVDSGNGFVTAGFVAGMLISTDCPNNLGPFYCESVTAGTITLGRGNRVVAQPAWASYTITSLDNYGLLPIDFWGLIGKPYISGQRIQLVPLPNQATAIYYDGATGSPTYYEIKGDKIKVTPGSSTDITILGNYFKKPAKITSMDDVLPYNELFDMSIVEYLGMILNGESPGYGSLEAAVDVIMSKRQNVAPTRIPPGIPWEDLSI